MFDSVWLGGLDKRDAFASSRLLSRLHSITTSCLHDELDLQTRYIIYRGMASVIGYVRLLIQCHSIRILQQNKSSSGNCS